MDKEFKKALQIINNLIDGMNFLPLSWDDMITFDVSEDIKEFMRKHDPENWGADREKPMTTKEK